MAAGTDGSVDVAPEEMNPRSASGRSRRRIMRDLGLASVGIAGGVIAGSATPAAAVGGLDDLTDVDLTGAQVGDALVLGGSATWVPGKVATPSSLYCLAPVLASDTAGGFNLATVGLPTIDFVSIPDGGRFLLTNQSTASNNGIWVAHSGSAPTRPSDFASGSQVLSRSVRVVTGNQLAPPFGPSINDEMTWYLDAASAITIDTSPQSWSTRYRSATGNVDPTVIPNQTGPFQTQVATAGSYADSGSGNIYHQSSYVLNTGTRPAVAVYGGGLGQRVWGGNFVAYGNTATAAAIGAEINFGATANGAIGTGILLASAGFFQTNGAFIQMKANNAVAMNTWGIRITNSAGFQPVIASGTLFATDGPVSCASGIDFGSATFTTAAIILPPGGNIALNSTTGTKIGTSQNQKLGFWNVTPVVRPSAFTLTYTTADKTLGAYTANSQGVAFAGINNAQTGTPYAKVADVNALRVAYENLRAFTEDGIQAMVAAIQDLQSVGLLR